MKFSIVIPVYNVEHYLRECLDSVLSQTYSDWEAICVNDGSTDGSSVILEEYAAKDSRFRMISQKNAGTAAARNTGLKVAKGDYIFFLDSDDWIENHALQILADNLNSEDVLCFSGKRYFEAANTFNPADELTEKQYRRGMDYYNDNALLARDFAFVCVVLRVYNRAFLIQNEIFFDADVSYEDNLWVPIMLYQARSIKVITDSLYVYRVREGSKMQEVSLKRKKDLLKVANALAEFFIPKEGFDKTMVYRAITHHYQAVFEDVSKEEKMELSRLCDWSSYRRVSQTKFRHQMNFVLNKMCFLFCV